MVKQSGPDDSVDLFHPESFRQLAQGKHRRGQIFDGPITDGERLYPPKLDVSVLPAGERALYRRKLRDAKLLGEVRVEHDLRTPGIDEEGDFVASVDSHIDQ